MKELNVMNKHGYIFVIQADLMDPLTLLSNGCSIHPDIDALYKAKCDLLDNELDEVQGCEFKITGTKEKMFMDDDMNKWIIDLHEIDWLVNMNECDQPENMEQVIAFYQM